MIGIAQSLVAAALGVGATVVLDLWNLLLARAFGIASLDMCLLGRWVGHLPRGTVHHERIMDAAGVRSECTLGWMAHYAIGISLAVGFLVIAGGAWLQHPTLRIAMAYGIGTVAFPFLLLQPALGLGVASSKAKRPWVARIKSLATHAVYGLGLYAFACAAGALALP